MKILVLFRFKLIKVHFIWGKFQCISLFWSNGIYMVNIWLVITIHWFIMFLFIFPYLHLLQVMAHYERVSLQFLNRFPSLALGSAYDGNLGAKRLAELHGKMPQPSEAHDADTLPGPVQTEMPDGAVDCDPGTKQWSAAGKRNGIGDTNCKVLVHDEDVRVPAVALASPSDSKIVYV